MQVQPINFNGNISKGRKEFEKLPLAKQVALKSIEKFRQNFNQNNLNPIPRKQTALAEFVEYAVSIEKVVKKMSKDIFTNLRNNMRI